MVYYTFCSVSLFFFYLSFSVFVLHSFFTTCYPNVSLPFHSTFPFKTKHKNKWWWILLSKTKYSGDKLPLFGSSGKRCSGVTYIDKSVAARRGRQGRRRLPWKIFINITFFIYDNLSIFPLYLFYYSSINTYFEPLHWCSMLMPI